MRGGIDDKDPYADIDWFVGERGKTTGRREKKVE